MSPYNRNGAVIYRGPSLIDGAPIVVVATGLAKSSVNAKTGDMVQTWIMPDAMEPHAAAKAGLDASVCGDCCHRPVNGGSCYVVLWRGPSNIWKAAQEGRYRHATSIGEVQAIGEGRAVRLGSYGDPAAVPAAVWTHLTAGATSWTGYTHQWRRSPPLRHLCMASVDSEAEAIIARAHGWRTFRVRGKGEPMGPLEFMCPASAEAGKKTDCAACKACMGTSAKARAHPVIMAHGPTARRFELTRNAA